MNLRRMTRYVLTWLGLALPMWHIVERVIPFDGPRGPIFLALFIPTWIVLRVWLSADETTTSNEEQA